MTRTVLRVPVVCNFFGGPGSKKSTTAAEVFAILKRRGVDVELVTEFAKDLTWERRHMTLGVQPYIHGKQLRNIERLYGGVDCVVTDGPTLLSTFYGRLNEPQRYPDSFHSYVVDQFRAMVNLNFFMTRTAEYNPRGRSQTEDEARAIDPAQREMLDRLGIRYTELPGDAASGPHIAAALVAAVENRRRLEAGTLGGDEA